MTPQTPLNALSAAAEEEREQTIFMCKEHSFVVVQRGGEIDCHGSPGHRVTGCTECDKAVREAWDAALRFADV